MSTPIKPRAVCRGGRLGSIKYQFHPSVERDGFRASTAMSAARENPDPNRLGSLTISRPVRLSPHVQLELVLITLLRRLDCEPGPSVAPSRTRECDNALRALLVRARSRIFMRVRKTAPNQRSSRPFDITPCWLSVNRIAMRCTRNI